jgi:DNA-binding transcriptional ArsR family regulator
MHSQFDGILQALNDRTRREILRLVHSSEMPAGAIASHFSSTRPAVSQHLRVLKDTGLITEQRAGARRMYRTRPEALAELRDYLQHFWDDRLLDLKLTVEAEEKDNR